jgi:hypothetical protein
MIVPSRPSQSHRQRFTVFSIATDSQVHQRRVCRLGV